MSGLDRSLTASDAQVSLYLLAAPDVLPPRMRRCARAIRSLTGVALLIVAMACITPASARGFQLSGQIEDQFFNPLPGVARDIWCLR